MKGYLITGIVVGAAVALACANGGAAQTLPDQVDERLRARLEAAGVPARAVVGDELVYASIALPRFYEIRTYRPAWSDDSGPTADTDSLVAAIRDADREGLESEHYHLAEIVETLKEIRENQALRRPLDPRRLADLDLLLTDAFLLYASHLLAGRVNPETIDPEWHANRRDSDLSVVLQDALASGRFRDTLEQLLPHHVGYRRLRQTLAQYRELAAQGGWQKVPEGPKMEKGDRGDRIRLLRSRMEAAGAPVRTAASHDDLFDEALEQTVRTFQRRYGLDVDGVVGQATLAALNIPVEARIDQIEVNLERWRWLPQELGPRHVIINIANFDLDVVEGGRTVLSMLAIVGRPYRRTPIFSDRMTYLVLNPHWHVPTSIAVLDILPTLRTDAGYLASQNMRVLQGWGSQEREIDPRSINWSEVSAANFPYRLRQDPGPGNALGRVKFMFPNKFNVYLHDTPARDLFARTRRTFSSGCIRIEKPIDLAEYLLRGDPQWTREKILAAIDRRVEQTVRLPEAIPIHLLYWTAWADEDGSIQFRNDIYDRDRLVLEALRSGPPEPTEEK